MIAAIHPLVFTVGGAFWVLGLLWLAWAAAHAPLRDDLDPQNQPAVIDDLEPDWEWPVIRDERVDLVLAEIRLAR